MTSTRLTIACMRKVEAIDALVPTVPFFFEK